MTEGPSESPNAATLINPLGVISHTHLVRIGRTMVNLPNVENICDALLMAVAESTGRTLLDFKERSGLSLSKIAKAAGYAGASSIQRYFDEDYDKLLPPEIAERLTKALVGRGRPAITVEEMAGLTAYSNIGAPFSLVNERVAAVFVWHVAQRFGAEIARDDPEVLRLAKSLQALLKLTASRQVSDADDLVDGLFAGVAAQSQRE